MVRNVFSSSFASSAYRTLVKKRCEEVCLRTMQCRPTILKILISTIIVQTYFVFVNSVDNLYLTILILFLQI